MAHRRLWEELLSMERNKIRVKINGHSQEIMDRDNYVTAEKVKNAFLGLEHRQYTLLKVFRAAQ